MVQKIQSQPDTNNIAYNGTPHSVFNSFRKQDLNVVIAESNLRTTELAVDIRFGRSTLFSPVGKQIAKTYTLNHKRSIAVRLIRRQLDRVYRDKNDTPQLCEFIDAKAALANLGSSLLSRSYSHA
jgi:hypothetical protein